jgi:hypothetical protein
MSSGRRYEEHEVRKILDLAISRDDAPVPAIPSRDGLTLSQLQEIGREVGLPPERISEAVAVYERRGQLLPRKTSFGLPTSVGSSVALPRRPTDHEWERLVAELRTTFGGKGVVTAHGSMREWAHSSFHAFVEPTETGYRLRMTDSRAAALGVGVLFGGFLVAFASVILIALLSKEDPGLRLLIPALFGLGGVGVTTGSAIGLPAWASEQEKRMEHISKFAATLLAAPASADTPR